MTTPPPSPPPLPPVVIVDRVEVSETFASSLRRWSVDGVSLHLEFAVNRWGDPVEEGGPPAMKVVTVARLVMPLGAVPELNRALSGVVQNLNRESPFKPTVEGPQTIN